MKFGHDLVLPASITGGASILSILTGLLNGVSVGVILIRALLTAVITLLFVLTASRLARKFLPELSESTDNGKSHPGSENSPPVTGSRVNIVMDDDTGMSAAPIGPSEGDFPQDMDNLGEKIAESAGNMHNNKPNVPDSGPVMTHDGDTLDVLPSLDNLELGSYSNSSSDELVIEEEPEATASSGFSQDKDVPGGVNDPAEIAKAVKTVLKRDQQE